MPGTNKVFFMGNAVAEPRIFPGGAEFRLAQTERWKDQNGNPQERTEFQTFSLFGEKRAALATKLISKGTVVYVEGKIRTEKYEDKEGNTRYTQKIVVDSWEAFPRHQVEPTKETLFDNNGFRNNNEEPDF